MPAGPTGETHCATLLLRAAHLDGREFNHTRSRRVWCMALRFVLVLVLVLEVTGRSEDEDEDENEPFPRLHPLPITPDPGTRDWNYFDDGDSASRIAFTRSNSDFSSCNSELVAAVISRCSFAWAACLAAVRNAP